MGTVNLVFLFCEIDNNKSPGFVASFRGISRLGSVFMP